MKFNREKCKVLHWGGTTPGTSICWGLASWKAALQKKILVDTKLAVRQQGALEEIPEGRLLRRPKPGSFVWCQVTR